MTNAACGVSHFRVRRWPSPQAAFGNLANRSRKNSQDMFGFRTRRKQEFRRAHFGFWLHFQPISSKYYILSTQKLLLIKNSGMSWIFCPLSNGTNKQNIVNVGNGLTKLKISSVFACKNEKKVVPLCPK